MNEVCSDAAEKFKPYSLFTAGALFGAGWWVWGDAIAVQQVIGGITFNWLLLIPGLVATLAILVMNCAPRSELNDSVYAEDAALCRSRLTLFISYVFSVAGIAASVAVLLHQKSQGQEDLWVGAASIIQTCLVVASGLVAWFFRDSGEDEGYGYVY